MKRLFSAPTTVNFELTELCNVKCKHCYNPWRDESMGVNSIDQNKLDKIINKFVDAKVFHVILTGGEPMSNFDILLKAIKSLREKNITVSCNSNLILANNVNTKLLSDAGLDHILTSLPSLDPLQNDLIMQSKGSLQKIINGIKSCVKNNIRVSVNMVITRQNMSMVFETAEFAHKIGVQKFFLTRAVPPTYSQNTKFDESNPYYLTKEETKKTLDDAIKAKETYGIKIGSLVSYPLCFLEDLDKYRDFVGRGCPSQSGHRMSINSNGDLHVCVHEEEKYGNVLETSIQEVYQNQMRGWHDGSKVYSGCQGCEYINMCASGCQMVAMGFNGDTASKDPLYVGPNNVKKHYKINNNDSEFDNENFSSYEFKTKDDLRFRDEKDFYLINIQWGNTVSVPYEIGSFIEKCHKNKQLFKLNDFVNKDKSWIKKLFDKGILLNDKIKTNPEVFDQGVSANLEDLPEFH
tara:strand:+ start:2312 stop:3700 length:1389 start_codon:yes stop_codon:yes gene_type:complete